VAQRILGIDPGLTRCGVGVVDAGARRTFVQRHVDVIRTSASQRTDARVYDVICGIRAVIEQWHPAAISVERVFAQHNLETVMGIGHVIGGVMVLAHEHGIPFALHTPSEVKAAVSGYGNAGKAQVTAMTCRLLGVESIPGPPDAADALAIAMCEALRPLTSALAGSVGTDAPGSPDAAPVETAAQRRWRLAREQAGRH
jgi:crossover junction endodeoxyribonuclease RuvC